MLIRAGIQIISVLFRHTGLLSWFNAQLLVQWDRESGKMHEELHKYATLFKKYVELMPQDLRSA